MSVSSELESEREALETLVRSDGWRRFVSQVEQQWGDAAVLQQLDRALAGVDRGDEAAERSTTAQVLAARKSIRTVLLWPSARLKEIAAVTAAVERRVPRRAVHRHGIGTNVTGETR